MIGGRRIRFTGDIPIGSAVRRESRRLAVIEKTGRSGRFVLVTIRHDVHVRGQAQPAIEEEQDYILREAVDAAAPAAPASAAASAAPASAATLTAAPAAARPADVTRRFTPTETLLFRYSAITFNPHRIHYDQPYATASEGYPALVVNGGIASILLLELFRSAAGREPRSVAIRNVAPLFCGAPVTLSGEHEETAWRMRVEDERGRLALEATIE